MKETSIVELKDEKNVLRSKSQEIINAAKAETRGLTAEEKNTVDQAQIRMAEIDLAIEERMDTMRAQRNVEGQKESKTFSLSRAIRNAMNGKAQEDAEMAVIAKAEERQGELQRVGQIILPIEGRAAMTGAAGASCGAVSYDDQAFVLPLENLCAVTKAGATVMTGLKGNLRFPAMSDVTIAWDAENDSAADGGSDVSSALSLTPKRLCAYVDISKQLLIQENQDVEGYLRKLIAVNIAEKIDSTILGKAAAGDGPAGIFNTAPTIKGTFSFANLVAMETAVNNAGGLKDKLAYILHPSLWGAAKQTPCHSTTGAGGLILGNDGMINGYKSFSTGNVAKEMNVAAQGQTADNTGFGAVFGNWSDFVIGNWGNLDITVDPYSQAGAGKVRLVVNSYWNYGMLHSGSFKTAALKLA